MIERFDATWEIDLGPTKNIPGGRVIGDIVVRASDYDALAAELLMTEQALANRERNHADTIKRCDLAEERVRVLTGALRKIQWQKDCGCDGKNEAGEYVNFPEAERDAMYEIATEAVGPSKP